MTGTSHRPDQPFGATDNEQVQARIIPEAAGIIGEAEGAFEAAGLPDPWGEWDELTASQLASLRRAADGGSPRGAVAIAQSLFKGVTGVAKDKAEALRWYRVAAERGFARAMNMVGRFHTEGWGGLEKDPVEAAAWYRHAADAGHASGAYNLADSFDDGHGVTEDKAEALRWYRVAAERGHAGAMNMVGRFHTEGWGGLEKDLAEAAAWYRHAADAGHSSGAYNLAAYFHNGHVVTEDKAEALRWYRVAAERGHARAMNSVGRFHTEGWGGLEKDPVEAAAWYRHAADAGHASGAYNLAAYFHNGHGVTEDKAEALRWYRVAAERGFARAMNMVGRFHTEGWGGLEKDPVEAAAWYRHAADAGHASGAYNLAAYFHNGHGVTEDKAEALRWYRVAAERGFARAMNMVGRFHTEGWGGLEKDPVEAAAWYRHAADAGHASGAYNLADSFDDGHGVTEDKAEALRWYRVAAERGHAGAMNMVGRFHTEGWGGLEKDLAEAAAWYRHAADAGHSSGAYNLAAYFHNGHVVTEDKAEALRWYRVAAERGHARAMNSVGRFHTEGWGGLEKDPAEAAAWYRRAVEAGDLDAEVKLAILLVQGGPGIEVDTASAAYFLRRGAERGNAIATTWLGHLHERGLPGVAASKAEAMRLFKLASDGGITWAGEQYSTLTAATLPPENPLPIVVPYDSRFRELDALLGLQPVKAQLRAFAQTMDVARRRRALGLRSSLPTAHMLFLGNPGTGKTTVARIVGKILRSIGVLQRGHVVEVDRAKLVQVYIGETEKRTAEFIEQAMDGVLFVDEAYTLVPPDNPRDHGLRALDTILTAMENHRGRLVVIFAGYEREMQRVLDYNPGFASRVPNHLRFPDYAPDELLEIALGMVTGPQGFGCDAGVKGKLRQLIEDRFVPIPENFANARSMRNLVEEIVARHAARPGANLRSIGAVDIPDPRPRAVRRSPLDELNGMIGLPAVKQEVKRWSAQLRVARLRAQEGVHLEAKPNHMVFTGAPGTGKTVVAGLVARILVENGMLKHDRIHAVTRSDLVGQYQGQTAPKVTQAFQAAEGGVLFIDEAYALTRDEKDSFGREAIDTMVPLIENMRDRLVVMLAGYKAEMEEFLDVNPGLRSRFPTRLHFEDYSTGDLLLIFEKFCFDRQFHLAPDARRAVEGFLARRAGTKDFGNARGVRNLVDEVLGNMDMRLAELPNPSRDDLFRIEAVDVPEAAP